MKTNLYGKERSDGVLSRDFMRIQGTAGKKKKHEKKFKQIQIKSNLFEKYEILFCFYLFL